MPHVLAWDIETVPNVSGYAAANGLEGKSDDEIRDANGRQISQAQPIKNIRSTACRRAARAKGCRQSNSIQFNWHGRGTNAPIEHYTGGYGMSFVSKIKSPSPRAPSPRWGFSFLGTSGRDLGEQCCTDGFITSSSGSMDI
jgi:hypothetical protein